MLNYNTKSKMRIVSIDNMIIQELRRSGLSHEMKSLEACKFLVIEEREGKIVGAGGVGGIFNVPSLQISEEMQGKGIGKILLGATIEEARKRGYSFISGSRNPENSRAIKLHDFYGFYPIFRIHYSPGMVRDIIILILKPKGKIVSRFFSIFNTLPGTIVLAFALKIAKRLFRIFLTYPPEEFPDPGVKHIISNFEKLSKVQ